MVRVDGEQQLAARAAAVDSAVGKARASKSLARRSYTLQENSSPSNEGTYAAQRLRLAACKNEGS